MFTMPSFSTPDPPGADWAQFLHTVVNREGERFDLTQLRVGDLLQVFTTHTVYTLTILSERDADLATNRPDRACGRVRIMGCTFGLSSSIMPDHLFCGGNLEFLHDSGQQTCTTTAIRAIQLMRRSPPA